MYRKEVRRRRTVLAVLVVAGLTMLSLYFQEGPTGPLHTGQGLVSNLLGPVEEGANRALKPPRDLINWFSETFDARGENARLRDEVADLRNRLAQTESTATAGSERAKLDSLIGGLVPTGSTPVDARVIGRSPTVWYSTVVIDKGSSAGVRLDDPVVSPSGLAGRVTLVNRGNSEVTLITDSDSSVAARVLPSGTIGVVEPELGKPENLQLNYIRGGEEIRKGQMVVTAGFSDPSLSALFPPGIPIGRVSEVSLEELQAYQRVDVRVYADLRDMDYVKVLASGGKG